MSLLVGQTVATVTSGDSGYTGPQVGVAMALFGGIIAAAIGFVRLGILVDFIPEPAIGNCFRFTYISFTKWIVILY